MKTTGRGIALCACLLAAAARAQGSTPDPEDWASSPEAYFLTPEEKAEWAKLDSRDSRAGFKERYWLKRDPTPGTERNEFRETILARIKTADERFAIEKTPGSRTARGFVFVVFGTPARVRDEHATPARNSGRVGAPVGALEGTETVSHWYYELNRTPRILEALGLPKLEVQIIIDPNRHLDAIQSPGLVKELSEKLAYKSIVNPDLIPPETEARIPSMIDPLPHEPLDASVRSILESAPPVSRSGDAVFGQSVLWRDTGGPETLVWFYLPPAPAGASRFLRGVVRKETGGEEIATLSEPVSLSDAFSSSVPGEILMRRLPLPAGSYDAAFAVMERNGAGQSRAVASAETRISVPDLSAGFSVSPLLLSRGPGTRTRLDEASPFAVGAAVLPPRADAVFSASESLWFFLEFANAPDPAKVTLEVRLRKGSDPISSRKSLPAQPSAVSPSRHLCGYELPMAGLVPGDYRLYVLVRDGVAADDQYVLRSADFRLKP